MASNHFITTYGNIRASTDDGDLLCLTVFDPRIPGAPLASAVVPVLLDELRQIVDYFSGDTVPSSAEKVIGELETNPELARRFASVMGKQIIGGLPLHSAH
jgi:hypothetical protein